MSPKEYANRLRAAAEKLNTDYIITVSVGSAIADMAPRIFERGEDVNGGTRNYNTTDEIWVSDLTSPKGKQNSGKTGRAEKTSHFSSYNAYMGKMGRPNGTMRFKLSNDLQSDLLNSPSEDTITPNPKLVDNLTAKISLERSENVRKAEGLERRFGVEIFKLSKSEIQVFRDVAAFEFRKLMAV